MFSTQKQITSFDIAIANYSLGEDCNYLTAYTKTLSNCKLKNKGWSSRYLTYAIWFVIVSYRENFEISLVEIKKNILKWI